MDLLAEGDDKVLILKDLKAVPDIVYNYTAKDHKLPLVIDNGSYQSRVGFASSKKPQLVFRNLVAKPRKDRNKKETKEELQNVQPMTLIGNDIINIEAMRFQLRTQFDRNVVTHYYLQVSILVPSNDYHCVTNSSLLRNKFSTTFSLTWESTRKAR